MKCPNCEQNNPEGSAYCRHCGYPLGEEVVEQTVVAPQPIAQQYGYYSDASEQHGASPTMPTMQQGPVVPPVAGRTPKEHDSQLKRNSRQKLLGGFIFALFVAALGFGVWWTYQNQFWGGKIIPVLVGMTQESAITTLEELGLRAEVDEELADTDIGTVLAVDPHEGTRVADDSLVRLTVAAPRVIPAVDGLSFDEARALLEGIGLHDITVNYTVSNREEGTVIAIEPAEGEVVSSTTPITVTIAQAYTVPNVVGKKLEDAIKDIEAAGLGYRILRVSSTKESNTVVATAPSAGTKMMQGAVVELSVASPNPDRASYLPDYFSMTPEEINTYLGTQYAVLEEGYITQGENIYARFNLVSSDKLIFTDQIASPERPSDGVSTSEPFSSNDYKIKGVRYEFADSSAFGPSYDLAGVATVLKACNISGETEAYVTEESFKELAAYIAELEQQQQQQEQDTHTDSNAQDNESASDEGQYSEGDGNISTEGMNFIHTGSYQYEFGPDGWSINIPNELIQRLIAHPFICARGKQGDDYTWVVLITEEKTVCAYAPNETYQSLGTSDEVDLTVAYTLAYLLGGV